jgi:hypothetical protein
MIYIFWKIFYTEEQKQCNIYRYSVTLQLHFYIKNNPESGHFY